MKISEPIPNTYLVEFKDNHTLAMSFLRIQEHYESPNEDFRNRPFTLEEYKEWYIKTFGEFSYPEDWLGFNIPSSQLDPFYEQKFDPLSDLEIALLKGLRRYWMTRSYNDPYYVIGIVEGDTAGLNHELTHARFYLNEKYKREVESKIIWAYPEIIKCLPGPIPIGFNEDNDLIKYFRKNNYGEHVFIDEINAYLLWDRSTLKHGGVDIDSYKSLISNLTKGYERHFGVLRELK